MNFWAGPRVRVPTDRLCAPGEPNEAMGPVGLETLGRPGVNERKGSGVRVVEGVGGEARSRTGTRLAQRVTGM